MNNNNGVLHFNETISHMTIREKIGQMLVAAYFEQEAGRMLVSEGFGGIWPLFEGLGIKTSAEMQQEIQALNKLAKIPLFVCSDMETGVGQYCHDGTCTEIPGLMAFGAISDIRKAERLAYDAGCLMASEAPLTGVNISPSPVVDVNITPENPICNIRSVSDNHEIVSIITSAIIQGMQSKKNLIAMAKHFPGEGMHKFDPHFDYEQMEVTEDEMDKIHLKPFVESIKAGVKCIMTNHAIYNIYDNEHPCTLSTNIITGLLRNKLRYTGLVMTDAMGMQGIRSKYGDEEALIMAVEAGNDLILAPGQQENAINVLEKCVLSGRITQERIDKSVRRIIEAKQWLGLFQRNRKSAIYENKEKRDGLAMQIARESITVARDLTGTLPMKVGTGKFLVLEPQHPKKILDIGLNFKSYGLYDAVKEINPDTDVALFPVNPTEWETKELIARVKEYKSVVIGTSFRSFAGQVGLLTINQVELLKKVVEVLPNSAFIVSNPYVIAELPFAKTIIVNYSTSKVSVEAAVDVLFGNQKASGVLAVRLPKSIEANNVKIVAHD